MRPRCVMPQLAFEGALLWTCGSQGFSQAANFVRMMPLQAKPNEAGALISAVEATRQLIAEQVRATLCARNAAAHIRSAPHSAPDTQRYTLDRRLCRSTTMG